ncbi:uncharacterized protein LOC116067643 [Sander lucioperca]|uniref:uncharacterized protein LOC116067643 n=1 Tax=Sander lucioperca TaxID=283035 RepID=UPI00125CFCEF|nr:uncharacterized protein LOC116067643 [Sander lucioperca]
MRGVRGTRGGQTENKKTESIHSERGHRVDGEDAIEEEALKGASCVEDDDGREPTLSDLAGIIRSFAGQQEAREEEWRAQANRQEHQFKALQHQFRLLQQEVEDRTSPVPKPASTVPDPFEDHNLNENHPRAQASSSTESVHPTMSSAGQSRSLYEPRLEKLTENDDVEHFLITFERIAVTCRWPKVDWVFRLLPLLTSKARGAYVHMDMDDAHEYDKVKSAILKKYDINPETYRQRFRSLHVEPEESPQELYGRLKELYVKWIQPQGKTLHEISEVLIMEQYLRMLSPELQVWVKEHGPKSAAEAATLADVFVAAREKGQPWSSMGGKDCHRPIPPQHQQRSASGAGKPPMRENQYAPPRAPNRTPICYFCGQEGHIKPMCPKNPVKLTQMCFVPRQSVNPEPKGNHIRKMVGVKINGVNLRALIDTGSTQTLVQRKYVPANAICTLETVPICCIHGDEKSYPTADIYLEIEGQAYLLNVGAVLLQGPKEERHPVAYISRKLLPREVRYSTVEKEALAVKWALDSFKYYLMGREFILESDHKALQWLERMKYTNGRITRWYLAMQPFRFTVQYIPGKFNTTADYLSRWPSGSSEGGGCVMATAVATQPS